MATDISAVPSLQTGDNLTREEFVQIWEQLPHLKKAELIGGIVYMPSPVATDHGDTEFNVTTWLGVYKAATPGCTGGNNTTSFLLDDCPQADVNLRLLREYGGKAWVQDKYLHGSPEMFVEVCNSRVSYDLHQKYNLYEQAGVQEYVAVIVRDREIRWHRLVEGKYELMPPDADGIFRSRVFPGLWLDGKALLEDNIAQVLAKLQEGIASEEHQRFVLELAARRQGAKP